MHAHPNAIAKFSDHAISFASRQLFSIDDDNPTPPGAVFVFRTGSGDARVAKFRFDGLAAFAEGLALVLARVPHLDEFDAVARAVEDAGGCSALLSHLAHHPVVLFHCHTPDIPSEAASYRPGQDVESNSIVLGDTFVAFTFGFDDGTLGHLTMAPSVAFLLQEHAQAHLVHLPF